MSEEREPAVERIDDLIEEIVHELNSIQVRRRSIEELDPALQGEILGTLKSLLPLIRTAREEIDAKLSEILDKKMEP